MKPVFSILLPLALVTGCPIEAGDLYGGAKHAHLAQELEKRKEYQGKQRNCPLRGSFTSLKGISRSAHVCYKSAAALLHASLCPTFFQESPLWLSLLETQERKFWEREFSLPKLYKSHLGSNYSRCRFLSTYCVTKLFLE